MELRKGGILSLNLFLVENVHLNRFILFQLLESILTICNEHYGNWWNLHKIAAPVKHSTKTKQQSNNIVKKTTEEI
jgi:hypothetical protein